MAGLCYLANFCGYWSLELDPSPANIFSRRLKTRENVIAMVFAMFLLRNTSFSFTNRLFGKRSNYFFHQRFSPAQTLNCHKVEIAAVAKETKRLPRNFVPVPFRYHEELILTIETLTNLGVGLGRVDISASPTPTVEATETDHSNGQYFSAPRKK